MAKSIFFIDLLLTVLSSSVGLIRADYPPPSENGHRYYSRRSDAEPSLTGAGRSLSSSFGSIPDGSSSDWTAMNSDGHGSARCVDVPSNLSLCRNMEYSQMRLPNLLEHDSLREVSQQASSWVRLLQVSCHPDTQIFLCSLFAPVCLERSVWPCRSLCEAVKSGCEDRMLRYGFPWPDMLRCDQYPSENDLCIGLRSTDNNGSGDTSCSACAQSQSYNAIIGNFCTFDFALRVKVEHTIVSGSDLKIVAARKRKLLRISSVLKLKEIREAALYIEAGANCDCATLEQTRHSTSYLVIGHKTNDRLIVDNIVSLEQRSKDVNRAMKAIRDRNACRNAATATAAMVTTGRGKSKNISRNKSRNITPMMSASAVSFTTATSAMMRNRQSGGRT